MRTYIIMLALALSACSDDASIEPTDDKSRKAPTSTSFQVVNMPPTDWNFVADTNLCGSLLLRWSKQQPKPSWERYVIVSTPHVPSTTPCSGGLNSADSVLYYQYGWGCSFFPSQSYTIFGTYSVRDSAQRKVFVYRSLSDTIKTGRGLWQCN